MTRTYLFKLLMCVCMCVCVCVCVLSHVCGVVAKTSTLKIVLSIYLSNMGRQGILVFY